jgi:hypothetical protein
MLAIAVLVLAGIGWWLFGTSVITERSSTMTFHRWFGRVTRIDVVFEGEKTLRDRFVYSWREPYEKGDPNGTCGGPPEIWEDRNGDGRWDTWMYRVGPDRSGQCSTEYRLDLNNDERPDWRFVSGPGEWTNAHKLIKQRRGF